MNDSILQGNATSFGDSVYYTALPIPLPPAQHDEAYEPHFLIIQRINREVFSATKEISNDIRKQLIQVCFLSVLIGAIGLTVIYMILWFVAKGLTEPLHWVKNVARSIVNHNDKRSYDKLLHCKEKTPSYRLDCGPKTEIKELVSEFRSMVAGFSGDGGAALAYPDHFEIVNKMTWQSDFQLLYTVASDATDDKVIRLGPSTNLTEEASDRKKTVLQESKKRVVEYEYSDEVGKPDHLPIVLGPPKKNRGLVNRLDPSKDFSIGRGDQSDFSNDVEVHRSSLFLWILFLIVAPLVLTSFVICFIVSHSIDASVNSWVSKAAAFSVVIEKEALRSATQLKAAQARILINSVVRDLHMMTRIGGWLLFGGLSRSESFTFVEQATQECRNYAVNSGETCPFYLNKTRAACSCDWNDSNIEGRICFNYNENDTRYIQQRYFASQRRDFDPLTGNRSKAISYGPGVDDKPSTTMWWDDVNELPGSEKGTNASGYSTAYDRLRVLSAMAIIDIPLYNYPLKIGLSRYELNSRIAFDADGMVSLRESLVKKKNFWIT
jgi:hypothetical protein